MDEAVSNSVAAQLRAAFPEGVFTQVDVLGYGDDPDVEPGETAIRAFVDRGGQPAETFEDDEEVMQAFEEAHRQAITWLHRDGQLPSIAWIQLIPDTPDRRAPGAVLWGFPDQCRHRRQPGRGHALGHWPDPTGPGLPPDSDEGARDQRD